MRSGKAARMELMKKLEKWKRAHERKSIDSSDYKAAGESRYKQALKSINCACNCGYDENNCPVPVKFCNFCINKDKCNCMNKEIDEHLKFTMGGSEKKARNNRFLMQTKYGGSEDVD